MLTSVQRMMADITYFVLLTLSLLAHAHVSESREILGLSCQEKAWMVASIGVKEIGRDPRSSTKTKYEVSVVCRDYLTARPFETKKAEFSSSIRARVSADAGYVSGTYEANYFRTNQFCFKASLTPDELLRGDVYHILTAEGTYSCPELRQINIYLTGED